MKKPSKKLAVTAGVLTAAAAAVCGISYSVTDTLTREALDRKEPKIVQLIKSRYSMSFQKTQAYRDAVACSELLEGKQHELVGIVSRDGLKLAGHWFPCGQAERVIIAMHGWRSKWSWDFGMISDFWFENRCSVLFVEQRAQGGSEGESMGFGMTERFDCLDWIEWVNARTGSALPVYLAGVSMGASTVLMASGLELPGNVKGIMADCGFTSAQAIWKHLCERGLHLSYRIRKPLVDAMCRKRTGYSGDSVSTLDALRVNTRPVLFVHGEDDGFVPVSMTYENYEACTAPKRLLAVPGADHGLSYYIQPEQYRKAILEFWDLCTKFT